MGIMGLEDEVQMSKFKCQIREQCFVIPQYKSYKFIKQEELAMPKVNEKLLDF
jgi:hypothetical protein